jgi:hypothetical protein
MLLMFDSRVYVSMRVYTLLCVCACAFVREREREREISKWSEERERKRAHERESETSYITLKHMIYKQTALLGSSVYDVLV